MPYVAQDIEEIVGTLADHMRRKLLRNTHKTHWSELSDGYLRVRLSEELKEQDEALEGKLDPLDVWDEAADVAFFAAARAYNRERS